MIQRIFEKARSNATLDETVTAHSMVLNVVEEHGYESHENVARILEGIEEILTDALKDSGGCCWKKRGTKKIDHAQKMLEWYLGDLKRCLSPCHYSQTSRM